MEDSNSELGEEARAGSLYGVRVGACPGVGPRGWLRWSAHPFGGAECRGHAQYPAFAPGSSEVAAGVVFFGLFVSCCPEFAPTAHAHSYF